MYVWITGNCVHCKSGSISEVVQDKRRCYYRPLIRSNIWPIEIAQLSKTLSDLQCHLPVAVLFYIQCN